MENNQKTNIAPILISFIVGIVIGMAGYYFSPLNVSEDLVREKIARDSLQVVVKKTQDSVDIKLYQKDSLKKISDKVFEDKITLINSRRSVNNKRKYENIKFLNSSDSAYISILSGDRKPNK